MSDQRHQGRQRGHVDWRRVLEDFAFLEIDDETIAARVGYKSYDLAKLRAGATPNGIGADRIGLLWCQIMNKSREFLPMVDQAQEDRAARATHTVPAREGAQVAFVELQQIVRSWAAERRQR